jgi:hypothetical protein
MIAAVQIVKDCNQCRFSGTTRTCARRSRMFPESQGPVLYLPFHAMESPFSFSKWHRTYTLSDRIITLQYVRIDEISMIYDIKKTREISAHNGI